MCYEKGNHLYPNGKRCAVNSPHGRRLGRRAKYFYGAATAENRGKLATLPLEFQEGSTYQRAVVARASTDPAVIELALRDRPGVIAGLASNPSLSVDQALQVASQVKPSKRVDLVQRNQDRPEIMEAMADDSHADVRAAVALAKATPIEVLENLSGDTTPRVASLAAGMLLPKAALVSFASDPKHSVAARTAVLRRKVTEEEISILTQLAANPAGGIRTFAALRTSDQALRDQLLLDSNSAVSRGAWQNIRFRGQLDGLTDEQLLKAGHREVRSEAVSTSTDADFLRKVLTGTDEDLRLTAGYNPALPLEDAKALAHVNEQAAIAFEVRSPQGTEIPVKLRQASHRLQLAGTAEYPFEEALLDASESVRRKAESHFFQAQPVENLVSAERAEDRLKAFEHRGLTNAAIANLLEDPDADVRSKAVQSFTVRSVADLDRYPVLLTRMRGYKTPDQDLARELISHKNPEVRMAGLRSLTYGDFRAEKAFLDEHPEYAEAMSKQSKAPRAFAPADVDRYFDNFPEWVQKAAIEEVDSPKMLSLRSKSRFEIERRSAAGNPLTPIADLKRLAKSKSDIVRMKAEMTLRELSAAA